MSERATKLPVRKEKEGDERSWLLHAWHPIEHLRHEIERLFEDFDRGSRIVPLRRARFEFDPFSRRDWTWAPVPAVDVAETDRAYEITVELPGVDEGDIEVKCANGGLTIQGEKHPDREEKKKDYYLSERHFGSFERCFHVPEGVDADKIEATFGKGVLTVTLPKTPEAQNAERKIPVKAA